jgi:hypothetical protein
MRDLGFVVGPNTQDDDVASVLNASMTSSEPRRLARSIEDRTMTWTSWMVLGARPVLTAGGGEVVVEPVEVIGAKAAERDVTDRRVDVVVDEPRVPVGGRRGCVGASLAATCR